MITVVLSTHNDAATLPEVLECLVPAAIAGLVREVVVADDSSTDATCAIADAFGADVLSVTGGPAAGLNAGAAVARAPWLMFLPADARLWPGFERELDMMLARDADIVAGFTMVSQSPGLIARLQSAGRHIARGWSRTASSRDCFLMRTATFTRLGGFTGSSRTSAATLRLTGVRRTTLDAVARIAGIPAGRRQWFAPLPWRTASGVEPATSATQTTVN